MYWLARPQDIVALWATLEPRWNEEERKEQEERKKAEQEQLKTLYLQESEEYEK